MRLPKFSIRRVGKKHAQLIAALIIVLAVFSENAFISKPANGSSGSKTSENTNTNTQPAKTLAARLQKVKSSTNSSNNEMLSPPKLGPPHSGLASSGNPELVKLSEYENVLGGSLVSRMMIFTDIPSSPSGAQSDAQDMAQTLKTFSANGINTLIIMEPTINGSPVDFSKYRAGAYDSILSSYFQSLKNHGINSSNMGMWVYFPEANLPQWGNPDPTDFAANVTQSIQMQKQYIPGSQSSIMLDAESYPPNSSDWDNGSYVSLSPYVSNIPAGLIDSFGLQGFPWAPQADVGGDDSFDPSVFLNNKTAADAGRILGVKSIWLNTGTFSKMYTNSPAATVTLNPVQRQTILNGIVAQAQALKNVGFNVSLNLFAENKANTDEATNWSYWDNGSADQSVYTSVLTNFAYQLYYNHIDMWLFDTE